jgi:anti-sigma regulatory factor (Ser/Thr protein kinase)
MKETERGENHLELIIPADLNYIKIVRMAMAGLGNILNLDIEEIENLKLAAGEACYNVFYDMGPAAAGGIRIVADADGGLVTLRIEHCAVPSAADSPTDENDEDNALERDISKILLGQLMDTVEFMEDGGGLNIVMSKKGRPR